MKNTVTEMKYLILNLPDTPKYVIHRGWAGSFGTGELKVNNDMEVFFPIWILYSISAFMNSNKDFKLIDAQAQDFDNDETISAVKDYNPDVVISMICMPSYDNDLEILDKIKSNIPNAKIVIFGGIANVLSEKILHDSKVDYLINGRYPFYNNLIELIKNKEKAKGLVYKKNGKIIKNPKLEDSNDLNEIKLEAYDAIDLNRYIMKRVDADNNIVRWIPILTGVGCPYPCTYCPYPLAYGKKFVFKDVDSIIDEITYIIDKFNITAFGLRDVVFTQDRERIIEFCNKIIKRKIKIKFLFETRANLIDKELLKILKKAGCYKINFGVESGNSKILENIGKPGVDTMLIKKAFALTREVDIINMAHIILGLPGENKKTIKDTYKLLKTIKADEVNLNYITPYPGTKLYDYAKSNNLIVDNNWSNYSSHNPVMRSEDLSVEDLRKIGDTMYRKYIIYRLVTDNRFRKRWIKKHL